MKALLVKDAGTEIPALAIRLDEVTAQLPPLQDALSVAILARAGYGRTREDHARYILLGHIDGAAFRWEHDPFAWGNLTMRCAHLRLLEDFDSVPAGGCIDVERMRLALVDAMGARSQVEPFVSVCHHDHDDPGSVA